MNFVNLEFTPVYHMIDASDSDLGDEPFPEFGHNITFHKDL